MHRLHDDPVRAMPALRATMLAWGGKPIGGGLAVMIMANLLLHGPLPVPGRDVRDVVWPLSPLLLVLPLVASAAQFALPFELRSRRSAVRRMVFLAAALLMIVAASTVSAVQQSQIDPQVLQRNGLFFLGLGLVAGWKHADTVLLAVTGYCALAWLLGSGGTSSLPQWWALPYQPFDHRAVLLVSVATGVAGILRFLTDRRLRSA